MYIVLHVELFNPEPQTDHLKDALGVKLKLLWRLEDCCRWVTSFKSVHIGKV